MIVQYMDSLASERPTKRPPSPDQGRQNLKDLVLNAKIRQSISIRFAGVFPNYLVGTSSVY